MQLDPKEVEEIAKTLYIRALKLLPPDIKRGFERLLAGGDRRHRPRRARHHGREHRGRRDARKTCCARTPAFRSTTSSSAANVEFDGAAMKEAIRRGCERATTEHPLRSSVVHPLTRKNEQTSCGIGVPIINVDFDDRDETVEIEMIPKGSGSENGSFLQMLIPADGVKAIKRFVIDQRDRVRRPRLPADHRRRRHRRHLGPLHAPRQGRGDAPARHARAAIPRAPRSRPSCRKP